MSRLSRGRDPASEKSRRKRKKKEKSTVVVRRSIRIFLETRVIFFFYYIYKRRDLITHLKKKKKVGSIHRGKAKEAKEVKREREIRVAQNCDTISGGEKERNRSRV